jgi:type IV secretory pathway VirB2 component (pilin)
MLLRALSGQGVAVAFVVVAGITLLLFLVGWRAIAALVARVRISRSA